MSERKKCERERERMRGRKERQRDSERGIELEEEERMIKFRVAQCKKVFAGNLLPKSPSLFLNVRVLLKPIQNLSDFGRLPSSVTTTPDPNGFLCPQIILLEILFPLHPQRDVRVRPHSRLYFYNSLLLYSYISIFSERFFMDVF